MEVPTHCLPSQATVFPILRENTCIFFQVAGHAAGVVSKKVILDIYCADGATKESILVDSAMTVGAALKLMAEKSCVDCHVKWGLVERLPELFIDRCLEDDEKLLRIISTWKPQTSNRLIFAQRPEKYDLFR